MTSRVCHSQGTARVKPWCALAELASHPLGGSHRRADLTTLSRARGFICAEVMAFDELKDTPRRLSVIDASALCALSRASHGVPTLWVPPLLAPSLGKRVFGAMPRLLDVRCDCT